MSEQERTEAEEAIRNARICVCVATSTLEIGIDIGDIDLVVIGEIPFSVAALAQRIGRGGRRKGIIHAVGMASTPEDAACLRSMFSAAERGAIWGQEYRRDISVCVQQVFSHLFQHRGGSPEHELADMLAPLCVEDELREILARLVFKDLIEFRGGRWFASTALMDRGERGSIHSNVPDSQTYVVKDVDSGQEVGRIAGAVDELFALAGRVWKVVRIQGETLWVRRHEGPAEPVMFKRVRNRGAFHYLLPQSLRE